MSDQTPPTTPEPTMQVVLEASPGGFAPRTRKSTADTLTSLKPSLDAVKAAPGNVYTIAKGITPEKATGIVNVLNDHHSHDWTFGARMTTEGTAIVQAKFDPANRRPVREPRKAAAVTPKPKAK